MLPRFAPLVLLILIAAAVVTAAAVTASAVTASADEPAKKAEPGDVVISGQISPDDPRDAAFGVPSKLHTLRLEQNKTYVVEVAGQNVNPFLHINDSLGNLIAQGQNRVPNTSRIRFTAPKDDIFLIYAGAHGNLPAGYTLTVKPYTAAAVKLHAMPAPAKNAASEVHGQLTHDDSPDQYRDFPGKVHTIDLKAGKTYVIDLMSKQFDTYLMLQDPNAVLIAQDDDSGGNLNSRLTFQPRVDGRYRLVATTFNGNMGAFTLRVAEK